MLSPHPANNATLGYLAAVLSLLITTVSLVDAQHPGLSFGCSCTGVVPPRYIHSHGTGPWGHLAGWPEVRGKTQWPRRCQRGWKRNKRNQRRNSGEIKGVAAELRALPGFSWCPAAPLQADCPEPRLLHCHPALWPGSLYEP